MAEKKLGQHPGDSDHDEKKIDLKTPKPLSDLDDLEGVPSPAELHTWGLAVYTREEVKKAMTKSSGEETYDTKISGSPFTVGEEGNKNKNNKKESQPGLVGTVFRVDIKDEKIVAPAGVPEEKKTVKEGEVMIGRFKLKKKIGEGAMSTVYEAYDTRLERIVAMKIIHPDLLHQDAIERMVKEARVMAKLDNKNISAVYEMGYYLNAELNPELFFIMPLYASTFNKNTVGKIGKMTKKEKIEFIKNGLLGLAEGLQKLHEKGFLHHDVKPENIFEDEYGNLKLADFGLVEEVGEAKKSTRRKGTPHFFSPEKAMIEPGEETALDERSDWFSFAATSYSMLTGGKLLFPKIKTVMELLAQFHNYADSEEAPFQFKKKQEWENAMKKHEVPRHFRAFLLQLLSVEPEQRIPANEVLSAYKEAIGKDEVEMEKLSAIGERLQEKRRAKRKASGYKLGA